MLFVFSFTDALIEQNLFISFQRHPILPFFETSLATYNLASDLTQDI